MAAMLAAAVLLGGCNGDTAARVPTSLPPVDATAPTVPATSAAPPTTPAAATTPAGPSTTPAPTTAPTTVTTTRAPAAPAVAPAHFTTPSGNIGCMIMDGSACCDIQTMTFKRPVDPTCELDYGQAYSIAPGERKGTLVCAGDTVAGGPKLSSYPARAQSGGTVCDIESVGVTCKNAGGHGFFLSAESYRLF